MRLGDKDIDTYSWVSLLYGWTKGVMKNPFSDDSVVSTCYQGFFEIVTECDFYYQDWLKVEQSLDLFNLLVFYPTNILKSAENVYE